MTSERFEYPICAWNQAEDAAMIKSNRNIIWLYGEIGCQKPGCLLRRTLSPTVDLKGDEDAGETDLRCQT